MNLKKKILKHLSEKSDTWASTISRVSEETKAGASFVEQAMKDLVSNGEVVRTSDGTVPQYQAPGAAEGKYASINDRRLALESADDNKDPTKTDTFEKNPISEGIPPNKAV